MTRLVPMLMYFLVLMWNPTIAVHDVRIIRCSPWKSVQGMCPRNCRLPVIKNEMDYEEIRKAMEIKSLKVIWIGLQRTWLGEFIWPDCTKPSVSFLSHNWDIEMNCASLNLREKRLEAGMCHMAKKVVLCQTTGCMSCYEIGGDCVNINGTCYIRKLIRLNWENAKGLCFRLGGSLAILPVEHEASIINLLASHFSEKERFPRYWVALRREEWSYAGDINFYLSRPMTTTHWAEKHPTRTGNCTVMKRRKSAYVWESVSCHGRYKTLCLPSSPIINDRNRPFWQITANVTVGKNVSDVYQVQKTSPYPTSIANQCVLNILTQATTLFLLLSVLVAICFGLGIGLCIRPLTRLLWRRNSEHKQEVEGEKEERQGFKMSI